MNICLNTYSKQSESQRALITLQERLPERISGPCQLTCDFHVVSYDNYFVLTLDIAGLLVVTCQRCLHVFQVDYCHQSQLAVCVNDAVAETLMEHFECIVAGDHQVDLVEILTDELHLYSPEKHPNPTDCDIEMSQWIGSQGEILPTTLGL